MTSTSKRIWAYAKSLPPGTPIVPAELEQFGSRSAVDQALSRLARSGELLRPARGVYVRPKKSRFGSVPPRAETLVLRLAKKRGEIVASHGAAAANALGLTTQVPVRPVFLTSGKSKRLKLGLQEVELRHAPGWLLSLPEEPAGRALRALAWMSPEQAEAAAAMIAQTLQEGQRQKLRKVMPRLPPRVAQKVSKAIRGG